MGVLEVRGYVLGYRSMEEVLVNMTGLGGGRRGKLNLFWGRRCGLRGWFNKAGEIL